MMMSACEKGQCLRKGCEGALGSSAAWFVNAMRTAVFERLPKAALASVLARRVSACEKDAKEHREGIALSILSAGPGREWPGIEKSTVFS